MQGTWVKPEFAFPPTLLPAPLPYTVSLQMIFPLVPHETRMDAKLHPKLNWSNLTFLCPVAIWISGPGHNFAVEIGQISPAVCCHLVVQALLPKTKPKFPELDTLFLERHGLLPATTLHQNVLGSPEAEDSENFSDSHQSCRVSISHWLQHKPAWFSCLESLESSA
jgi:hypothetical protein